MEKIYLPDFKKRYVAVKSGRTAKEIYSEDGWFRLNEFLPRNRKSGKISFYIGDVQLLSLDLPQIEQTIQKSRLVDFITCKACIQNENHFLKPVDATILFKPNDPAICMFFETKNIDQDHPVNIKIKSDLVEVEFTHILKVINPAGTFAVDIPFNPDVPPAGGCYTITVSHINGSFIAMKNVYVIGQELVSNLLEDFEKVV